MTIQLIENRLDDLVPVLNVEVVLRKARFLRFSAYFMVFLAAVSFSAPMILLAKAPSLIEANIGAAWSVLIVDIALIILALHFLNKADYPITDASLADCASSLSKHESIRQRLLKINSEQDGVIFVGQVRALLQLSKDITAKNARNELLNALKESTEKSI